MFIEKVFDLLRLLQTLYLKLIHKNAFYLRDIRYQSKYSEFILLAFAHNDFRAETNQLSGIFSIHLVLQLSVTMDFTDVIYPLHLISKCCGMTMFSINWKSATTKFNKTDFIWIIFSIFSNLLMNYFFWNSLNMPLYYHSELIRRFLPALYFGKYLINTLSIIWSIVMRKRIAKLLKMICDVDEVVSVFI